MNTTIIKESIPFFSAIALIFFCLCLIWLAISSGIQLDTRERVKLAEEWKRCHQECERVFHTFQYLINDDSLEQISKNCMDKCDNGLQKEE